MLAQLTLIFLCQLVGELIAGALAIPVPGPVIGMALLFALLSLRGATPPALAETAGALQRAMSLLFVPAGAGVMLHLNALEDAALPIILGLLASTAAAILVTGWAMKALAPDAEPETAPGGDAR